MLGITEVSRAFDGGADACAAGRADCNAKSDDGCEVRTSTDPAHCGGCDQACAAGFVCQSSECRCDADEDCTNGGACDAGRCTCSGQKCAIGAVCNAQAKCTS